MTDKEYIAELNEHLSVLPDIERESAVSFYELVFKKSGNSMDVMLKYGNPYALAKRIISEHSDFNETTQYINLKKDRMTASTAGAYQEAEGITPDDSGHYLNEPYGFSNAKGKLSGGQDYANEYANEYKQESRVTYDEPEKLPHIQNVQAVQPTQTPGGGYGYTPPPGASRKAHGKPQHITRNKPRRKPPWHIDKNDPNKNKKRGRRLIIIGAALFLVAGYFSTVMLYNVVRPQYYDPPTVVHYAEEVPAPVDVTMMPGAEAIPFNGDYADEFLPPSIYDNVGGTWMALEGTIRDIDIKVNDCYVSVTNSYEPHIEFSENVKYTFVDGVLTITSDSPGGTVNVGVPNILGNCKIAMNGGFIDISGVTLNTMHIVQLDNTNNGMNITGTTVNRSANVNVTGMSSVRVEDCTFGGRTYFDTTGGNLGFYSSTFNDESYFTTTACSLNMENSTLAGADFNLTSSPVTVMSTSLRGDMDLIMRGGTGFFNFNGFPEYYDVELAEITAPEFPNQQITIQLPDPNALTGVETLEYPDGTSAEVPNTGDNLSNYKITLDTIGVTADDLSISFTPPV